MCKSIELTPLKDLEKFIKPSEEDNQLLSANNYFRMFPSIQKI